MRFLFLRDAEGCLCSCERSHMGLTWVRPLFGFLTSLSFWFLRTAEEDSDSLLPYGFLHYKAVRSADCTSFPLRLDTLHTPAPLFLLPAPHAPHTAHASPGTSLPLAHCTPGSLVPQNRFLLTLQVTDVSPAAQDARTAFCTHSFPLPLLVYGSSSF